MRVPRALKGSAKWIFAIVVIFGGIYWLIPGKTVHSLSRYHEILGLWDKTLVEHFPQRIPAKAGVQRFTFIPPLLQRGASIQLRLRLPSEEVKQIYDQCSAKRTKSFFGGDWNSTSCEPDGMPTTFFLTGDSDQRAFTKDYEIMTFARVPTPEERPTWVPGASMGVAISFQRNEVVYWAERWNP